MTKHVVIERFRYSIEDLIELLIEAEQIPRGSSHVLKARFSQKSANDSTYWAKPDELEISVYFDDDKQEISSEDE